MSAKPKSDESNVTVECEYPNCEEIGKVWEFHHGDYCSNKCELKHEGRKELGGIKFDHCRCFTCMTELKEIVPPKPDHAFDVSGVGWYTDPETGTVHIERFGQEVTREAAVGFQHKTPSAGFGEKEHNERVVTGTVCDNCGNTDHTAHVSYLANQHSVVTRVVSLLEDVEFSVQEFHREYVRTDDIELALGKALE
ncbi:hypothetical protein [Natrialba taiwanensis]|uniref:Uncharacterized protein n=1 Tax=Natrialba taiwanensis DSM 12281 TaxID=1230458 RepID=L9ZZG1_9EURY|nr:hypothetical protein [Natrialba taiwanensis]ELY91461.1 hypothetical protein C484_10551 [Natrialba taiwanensis DSM 12281]